MFRCQLRGLRELAIEISDPTPPRRPQPNEDEAEQTQDPAFMPEVGEAPDDDVYGGTTDCVFKDVCLVVSLRNRGVLVPCECDGPLPVSFGNDLLKPFGINMHVLLEACSLASTSFLTGSRSTSLRSSCVRAMSKFLMEMLALQSS